MEQVFFDYLSTYNGDHEIINSWIYPGYHPLFGFNVFYSIGLISIISYDIMINPGDIHMNGYHDNVYINEIIL